VSTIAGMRRSGQSGQASVEWVGVVLLIALAVGALVATAPALDGRTYGGFLAHRIVCAVEGSCANGTRALVEAYGEEDAALVREHAPNLVYEGGERELPVDWRECRQRACASAPDDAALDAHHTDGGTRATAFTRLIRRHGRLYVQYWLYYPDSNTALAGSDKLWERSWLLPRLRDLVAGTPDYPGFHRDDWEAVLVRIDPDGSTWVRASSHGHFQTCKWRACRDDWTRPTGWVRVSRGSHSGHVPFRLEPHRGGGAPRDPPPLGSRTRRLRRVPLLPGRNLDERTTTGEGLRLIPLETHDRRGYRRLDEDVKPPWSKHVYGDPESDES
jgi:hypothetical protein